MKRSLRLAVAASMLLAAVALPASAARGGGGHGGGGHSGGGHGSSSHSGGHGHHGSGHHHRHSVFFVGAFAGGPYWWWWNGPYLYDGPWLPEVVDPLPVPEGVDASEGFWWYYCADSQTYFPYVQQCASEWQRVLPQPPK